MISKQDRTAFFVLRHEQETAAADAATDGTSRVAHLELALRYALLANEQTAEARAEEPVFFPASEQP